MFQAPPRSAILSLLTLAGFLLFAALPAHAIDTAAREALGERARARLGDGAGTRALIEVLLLHRRLADPRIRQSSSFGDIAVLGLIWLVRAGRRRAD